MDEKKYIGLIDNPLPWDGVEAAEEFLATIREAPDDDPMKEPLLSIGESILGQAKEYEAMVAQKAVEEAAAPSPTDTGNKHIGLIDEPHPWDGVEACERFLERIRSAPDDDPMKADMLADAIDLVERAKRWTGPVSDDRYLGLIDEPAPWDGVEACQKYLDDIEAAPDDEPMKQDLLESARKLVDEARTYEADERARNRNGPSGHA